MEDEDETTAHDQHGAGGGGGDQLDHLLSASKISEGGKLASNIEVRICG
jgi:hypothetical protein